MQGDALWMPGSPLRNIARRKRIIPTRNLLALYVAVCPYENFIFIPLAPLWYIAFLRVSEELFCYEFAYVLDSRKLHFQSF